MTVNPNPAPAPLSPSEERTWAMLSHLSVLANLFTGFLGPVAALIIYLVYKDRSRYVAYQSLQSLIMQGVLWIGGGILTGGHLPDPHRHRHQPAAAGCHHLRHRRRGQMQQRRRFPVLANRPMGAQHLHRLISVLSP